MAQRGRIGRILWSAVERGKVYQVVREHGDALMECSEMGRIGRGGSLYQVGQKVWGYRGA